MGRNNMGGDCVCVAVSEVRAERGESAGRATLLKSHKAGGFRREATLLNYGSWKEQKVMSHISETSRI